MILVKHAMPIIDPNVDACMWPISDQGRVAAEQLAHRLRAFTPDVVLSSDEPKAIATAEPISILTGVELESAPGLREHDRRGGPWMETEVFQESVHQFFDNPSDIVYGQESADGAFRRFHVALDVLLGSRSFENAVVVTHGTVITLYVSRLAGVDAFPLWERLGLPSYVVMSWPDGKLLDVVDSL